MKRFFKYFVVDNLTESIVGSFDAISDEVAIKVLNETIKSNDKLKLTGDSLALCCIRPGFDVPETYDEVKGSSSPTSWIYEDYFKNE